MKTLLISLLLVTTCIIDAQHVASGSLKKIPWGISKEAFIKKLPGKYLKNAKQSEDKVTYEIDLAVQGGGYLSMPTLSEEFEYMFYNDKLFGVNIKLMTQIGCTGNDTKKVQDRLTDITKTLEKSVGEPDKIEELYNKIAMAAGSFAGSTFAEWYPDKARENFPEIYIKINFSAIKVGNITSLNEIYLNSKYLPIHEAAKFSIVDRMKFLIEEGVDVNEKNDKDQTPLHLAAENNQTGIITLLLENNADLSSKDKNNCTVLDAAVLKGSEEAVELLINKGANINNSDELGVTPLHLAVMNNFTKIAELLIDKGAGVNTTFTIQWHYQLNKGNDKGKFISMDKAIELILAGKKDSFEKVEVKNYTALHIACENENEEMVKLLIDKGANCNAKDNFERTPSDVAKTEEIKKIFN